MTKRIKELAGNALDKVVPETWTILTPEQLDKFTEELSKLIVQECVTTILKESKWYWDKDEFESSNAIQNAARRVKEHFGVGNEQSTN